jgi:hypothetical protein
MAVIILWTVLMMAAFMAFMSGFIFGTGSNNVDLSNPPPEPTHSDSNSEWVNGFEDYYRSIEQSTTAPIPDDYYSQDCKLPTDQSMYEYLSNSHWIDDYEADSWDCSQMASYMEFMLENCGYHVVIREADVEGEQYGHAWILVEFKEGWLAYECTGRYWVYPSEEVGESYNPYSQFVYNPSMYDAGVQYESIYDVWDDYEGYSNDEEDFLKEYGWWNE